MEDRLNTITPLNIDHYIARLNIEHYKKMLETEIDEITRQTVRRLLAEEHANLVEAISKVFVREAEKDPEQKSAGRGLGASKHMGGAERLLGLLRNGGIDYHWRLAWKEPKPI
jgi:hypothetical protein